MLGRLYGPLWQDEVDMVVAAAFGDDSWVTRESFAFKQDCGYIRHQVKYGLPVVAIWQSIESRTHPNRSERVRNERIHST